METSEVLTAYQANVEQVADIVFRTMLGLQAEPYPMDWTRPANVITAVVYFSGSWNGAVLFECSRRQALVFTELLMSIDAPETVNEDVKDALGELANMLAGNLKSVLPSGVVLSLPSVIEGGDYSLSIRGSIGVQRTRFWGAGDVFEVSLVETAVK